ncbi:MAG: hypothetical protein ACK4PH_29300 [Aquincola tertiaricarbonis]|uniref:hypothetical protein n=1 Tax=Aquincola sp. J276 TaxID=2898432 RepID=UPI0021515D94|nr:hypothetical protein [Aquincola sp. J276]MCR5865748.1 hypothetical protein [Aquincola sp. J276]
MLPPSSRTTPERWVAETRGRGLLKLDIPPDAARTRTFEISCSLQVQARDGGQAWHGMKVLVDGAQQWARRVPTHEGGRDSLDVRFRKTVEPGRPLRLSVQTELHQAAPLALQVVAEEEA